MHKWNLMLQLSVLIGLVGCGPGGLPTGNVSGRVTQAGAPLTVGTVTLLNEQMGIGASAQLDAAGAYRMESVRTGDYLVAIQPAAVPLTEDALPLAEREAGAWKKPFTVPDKYRDPQTSGFTTSVSRGENTANFDVP